MPILAVYWVEDSRVEEQDCSQENPSSLSTSNSISEPSQNSHVLAVACIPMFQSDTYSPTR